MGEVIAKSTSAAWIIEKSGDSTGISCACHDRRDCTKCRVRRDSWIRAESTECGLECHVQECRAFGQPQAKAVRPVEVAQRNLDTGVGASLIGSKGVDQRRDVSEIGLADLISRVKRVGKKAVSIWAGESLVELANADIP